MLWYNGKGTVIGKNGDYHSRDYGSCCAGLSDVFSSSIIYRHGVRQQYVWNFDILLNRLYVAPQKTAISVNHSEMWEVSHCSRTPLIRIKLDDEPSWYEESPDNRMFLWKQATLAGWSGKQISTNGCFRLPIYLRTNKTLGARGGAVGWGTALQVGRSRVRFPIVSLEFFIDIILPASIWPWGWLSL